MLFLERDSRRAIVTLSVTAKSKKKKKKKKKKKVATTGVLSKRAVALTESKKVKTAVLVIAMLQCRERGKRGKRP